jgi:iron complex outermembrane recepter protein
MPKIRTQLALTLASFLIVGTSASSTDAAGVPRSLSMRNAPKKGVKRTPPKGVAQTPPEETPPPAPPAETPAETPPPAEPAPAETPAPAPAVETPVEPAPTADEPTEITDVDMGDVVGDAEVIVITGSLIERREVTTPAPVAVIDRQDIATSGLVSVGDILQNLPAQSNAINIQFNNGGDGSTRVNLRGVGSARTLTLLNGRRVVPGGTGADASVDLNSIPLAVIERVEVLKDGASAIYGSDAVGGVVNIITRDDFEGQEATAYTGTTQRGDGFVYDLSFVTGASTKKSNIVFSAGYTHQGEILAGERDFSKVDRDVEWHDDPDLGGDGDGTALEVYDLGSSAVPYGRLTDDGVPGNATYDAEVLGNCPSGVCTLDPATRAWRDFDFDDTSLDGDPSDFYNYQPENYLATPNKRYNVFSSGNYKFTDNVRGFFEGFYTHRASEQLLAPEPLFLDQQGLAISADNFYNPYGKDIGLYRRRFVEVGNRRFNQSVDTFRVVTGVDGSLPDDLPVLKNWKWEFSYNYGRTNAQSEARGSLIASRLAEAIGPSFVGDDGLPHCGTVDAPGSDDCVPIDLLGGPRDPNDPEVARAIGYMTFTGLNTGFNEQRTFAGTVRGPLFNTPWGGFAVLALGADYREEAGAFTPDPLVATGDTTGNAIEPTEGDFNVVEGFTEFSFVPVTGKPGVEWLELTGAVRAFDYSTFGSDFTWKTGALFRTSGGVGLRGTYSTAFRAPSIADLYSGTFDDFPPASDPCDTSTEAFGAKPASVQEQCTTELGADAPTFTNTTSQIRTQVGGNTELEAETAKTYTFGALWEAPMVPGLAITFDYFHLNIDNAIQQQGIDVILSNCYTDPAHQGCEAVHRLPNGILEFVDDRITNIGGAETNGLDFAIGYTRRAAGGNARVGLEGTYLLNYKETDAAGRTRQGRGVYDLGVFPRWKGNLILVYGQKEWNVGMNWRYVHSFRECENNACNDRDMSKENDMYVLASRKVPSNVTGDLFGAYAVKSAGGTTTISAGINNVLDEDPPPIYVGFYADSDASTYDFMGRYYYIRLSQLF